MFRPVALVLARGLAARPALASATETARHPIFTVRGGGPGGHGDARHVLALLVGAAGR